VNWDEKVRDRLKLIFDECDARLLDCPDEYRGIDALASRENLMRRGVKAEMIGEHLDLINYHRLRILQIEEGE